MRLAQRIELRRQLLARQEHLPRRDPHAAEFVLWMRPLLRQRRPFPRAVARLRLPGFQRRRHRRRLRHAPSGADENREIDKPYPVGQTFLSVSCAGTPTDEISRPSLAKYSDGRQTGMSVPPNGKTALPSDQGAVKPSPLHLCLLSTAPQIADPNPERSARSACGPGGSR